MYLTQDHQLPTAFILKDDHYHPTATLIEANDSTRLRELGIYPHVTMEGPAPLGYTDWVLDNDTYSRTPLGTVEEIALALEQQAVDNLARLREEMKCTPRQARLALKQQGLLTSVEDLVDLGPDNLKIEWEYATEIRRTWPLLITVATELNLTDIQLDELFQIASTL